MHCVRGGGERERERAYECISHPSNIKNMILFMFVVNSSSHITSSTLIPIVQQTGKRVTYGLYAISGLLVGWMRVYACIQ